MILGKLISLAGLLLVQASYVSAQTFSLASNPSITYRLEDDCIVSNEDMTGPQTKEACDAQGLGCCSGSSDDFACVWASTPVRMCRDSCVGESPCRNWNSPSSISVGPGSCTGIQACTIGATDVGANACIGRLACSEAEGTTVGDGACVGFEACTRSKNSSIGKGSCSVKQACRYFSEATVGEGSCNAAGSGACQSFTGTAGDCVPECKGSSTCVSQGLYDSNTGECVKQGATQGDPHFLTWANVWYDYMGACDLVFLRVPNFDNESTLAINVRTKIRHKYSYIESAVVKIGDDTLEIGSFGEYFLNGVDGGFEKGGPGAGLMTLSGYPVSHTELNKKQHKFEIRIADEETILVSTFKDMVSVRIENATSTRYHDSQGMMGDFETGTMLARDGVTVLEDPNEFAAEWQVREDEPMLFQTAHAPQHPQQCKLPDPATTNSRNRRLRGDSISREAAKAACAHWEDEGRQDACVYDVLLTGDLEIAGFQ